MAEQSVETSLLEKKLPCCNSHESFSDGEKGIREVSSGMGSKLMLLLRQEPGQGDDVGLDLRRVFTCAVVHDYCCASVDWEWLVVCIYRGIYGMRSGIWKGSGWKEGEEGAEEEVGERG